MDIPYLVRRARLVLGQTQTQFAEQFEVDDGTVSRWERGKLRPSPAIVAQLRETVLRMSFVAGKELIRASPILKLVAPIDDLKHPCVISKGVRVALKRAGIPDHDLSTPLEVQAGTCPELSGAHALDVIQADPAWVNKRAAYAEAHCIAPRLGTWVDAMLIPLPDEPLALTEFIPSSPEGGSGCASCASRTLRGDRICTPKRNKRRKLDGAENIAQCSGPWAKPTAEDTPDLHL